MSGKFEQGDIVQMKGTSYPQMSVQGYTRNATSKSPTDSSTDSMFVRCKWWSQKREKFITDEFAEDALEPYDDDEDEY